MCQVCCFKINRQKKNIIWATDTYEELGEDFTDKVQISIKCRCPMVSSKIQPNGAEKILSQCSFMTRRLTGRTPFPQYARPVILCLQRPLRHINHHQIYILLIVILFLEIIPNNIIPDTITSIKDKIIDIKAAAILLNLSLIFIFLSFLLYNRV